jgi:hypothetical protein
MNDIFTDGLKTFLSILFCITIIVVCVANIVNYIRIDSEGGYVPTLSIGVLLFLNAFVILVSLFVSIYLCFKLLRLRSKDSYDVGLKDFPRVDERTQFEIEKQLTDEIFDIYYTGVNSYFYNSCKKILSSENIDNITTEDLTNIRTNIFISPNNDLKTTKQNITKYLTERINLINDDKDKKNGIVEKAVERVVKKNAEEIYKYMGISQSEATDIAKTYIFENLKKDIVNGELKIKTYLYTGNYDEYMNEITDNEKLLKENERKLKFDIEKLKQIDANIRDIHKKINTSKTQNVSREKLRNLEHTLERLLGMKEGLEYEVLILDYDNDNPEENKRIAKEKTESFVKITDDVILPEKNDGSIQKNIKAIEDNTKYIQNLKQQYPKLNIDFDKFAKYVNDAKSFGFFRGLGIYFNDKYYPQNLENDNLEISTLADVNLNRSVYFD